MRCPGCEGVPEESYAALAARYGHAAEKVLQSAADRGELAQPIVAGLPDLLAEAVYAAAHEQAGTVGDVLLRRTRLGLLAGREICAEGSDAPRRVARAIGAELGWDERTDRAGDRALPRRGSGRGHRARLGWQRWTR